MNFSQHTIALRNEFESYYSAFDTAEDVLLPQLESLLNAHPEDSSYARKSRLHVFLCQKCPVKIFRHTPLFFEISSGRGRHTWGGLQSKVGSYLHNTTAHLWLNPYSEALQKDREEGFLQGWNNPVGFLDPSTQDEIIRRAIR